jgi:hypothetical protein
MFARNLIFIEGSDVQSCPSHSMASIDISINAHTHDIRQKETDEIMQAEQGTGIVNRAASILHAAAWKPHGCWSRCAGSAVQTKGDWKGSMYPMTPCRIALRTTRRIYVHFPHRRPSNASFPNPTRHALTLSISIRSVPVRSGPND